MYKNAIWFIIIILILTGCRLKNNDKSKKMNIADEVGISDNNKIYSFDIDLNVNKLDEIQHNPAIGDSVDGIDKEEVIKSVLEHAVSKKIDLQVTANGPVINGKPIILLVLEDKKEMEIEWEYPGNVLIYKGEKYYIDNQEDLNNLYNICKYDRP